MKPIVKNILFFAAGVAATILILLLISTANSDGKQSGLTIFKEKGECLQIKKLEIFQVLEEGVALAHSCGYGNEFCIGGMVVLLVNNEGKHYYDQEKINVKKCARQVGTYRYQTRKDNFEKVVPAVLIE